ncbi:phage tail tape measure protein [Streptomyces sp. NPDC088124]|uniref:phage tail tape measure protein n=1 Tax=Streptomyces sp. NPDC088124 TaxID=3154654 RepID=UPI00343F7272
MANVGYATLQVIPSVRGIGDELRRQLVAPAGDSGQQAGDAAGGGFSGTFKGALAATGVVAIAAALGAQFMEGFTAALEQTDTKNLLAARLGSSGPEAKRQGDAVGKLFTSGVTENFEQGAEAVREVVRGGLVPPDATVAQLESIGTKMTDVANVFGTDMNLQSQAVSAILKNKLAPDATSALDLITVGFQKLGPNADDLLETFQEYPVQLKKLGLDAQTSMGLFQQGMQGGARDTDIVADALKEFGIRSIDMSQGSQDAYKALGLNAETMSLQIAKGGKGASDGLQTVLDKLRDIKDPVAREAAAVGLFGTQAEELGSSLFKLDPGKARSTFGDVAGAAENLGETLRSGPSYQIKAFTRTMKQGLVDFIGGTVLPALSRAGGVIRTVLAGPLQIVRGAVTAMGAAFKAGGNDVTSSGLAGVFERIGLSARVLVDEVGGGFRAMFAAFKAGGSDVTSSGFAGVMERIGLAARGVADLVQTRLVPALAGVGNMISTRLLPAVTSLVGGVLSTAAALFGRIATILIGTLWPAIIRVYSAFMGALQPILRAVADFVMQRVVPAVQMIGAKLSELVARAQPVISVVTSVVSWLGQMAAAVTGFVVPVLLRLAGPIFSTVFSILGMAIGFIGGVIGAVVTFGRAVGTVAGAVGSAFMWLWNSAIGPAMSGIRTAITVAWSIIRPVLEVGAAVVRKSLGLAFSWLYNSVVKPVWNNIKTAISTAWGVVRPVLAAVAGFLRGTVGAAFSWLYNSIVKPVWNGIKSTISGVWNNGLKPVFDRLKSTVGTIGGSFRTAKDAVAKAWAGIRDAAKGPVNFVLGTVWNDGLLRAWNAIAGWVGLDEHKLKKVKLLARGGTVGTEPGIYNRPTAIVGEGNPRHPEYVIPTDPKYRARALALHAAAGTQLLAGGGVIGTVKDWGSKAIDKVSGVVSGAVDFLTDPGKAMGKLFRPILDKLAGITGGKWGKAISRVPHLAVDGIKSMVTKLIGEGAGAGGDVGGSGVQRWAPVVLQALRMVGQPASLLQTVLRRMNQESGGNPRAINLWDSNAKAGIPSKGLMQTIDPTFNAYAGALRGRGVWDPLANIYASMRYALSRYGSLAAAYNRPGGYANGGNPKPGETFWVGERGPELMRLGSNGATIWDSATSMSMAAGLGPLRGFAKGTTSAAKARAAREAEARRAAAALKRSQAKAKSELPDDLTAFRKALTGSSSDIAKAAAALTKDLKAAGGAGVGLAKSTDKAASKLQQMAGQRDAVRAKVSEAKAYAGEQTKAINDLIGLAQFGEAGSIGELLAGIAGKQSTVRAFQTAIGTAQKKGASKDVISQLAGMGADSKLAGLVANASINDVKALNSLVAQGGKLSSSYGRNMADFMFDAGKDAGKGFLTGLLGQEKAIQAAMIKLGNAAISAIRGKKGLNARSPARALIPTGRDAGAGLVVGMDSTAAAVAAAAVRMADAAVPAGRIEPAMAAPSGMTAAAGLQGGQRVRLVVQGREFEAYVEELADERTAVALTAARRRYTSSRKG